MSAAVLYGAKSTSDVHGSIPDQLADGRALAEREGLDVVAEYSDEAASAYHGNRGEGLAQAKAHAERLGATLIVQHSDRLARGDGEQADHLVEVVLWARRARVTLRSVQDPQTFETSGLVYAALMGDRNNEDSSRRAMAVKGGMRRRAAERGKLAGGPRPYGYRWASELVDGKRVGYLEVVRGEADVVRRIFDETINGASQKGIARALTDEQIPTTRGLARWTQSAVGRILRNPLYRGAVHIGGEEFPGAHDPIVTVDVWKRAAAIRDATARTKGHGGGRLPRGPHLFTRGLLRCGLCGATMTPVTKPNRTGGTYEVYECLGRRADVKTCIQRPVTRAAVDDAMLAELLRRWVDLDETRDRLRQKLETDAALAAQQLAQADRELQAADARLARVRRAFQNGHIDAEDYRDQRAELREEREAALSACVQAREHAVRAEGRPGRIDAESELLRHLADLRERVTAGIRDAAGLDGLRRLLHHTFEEVRYMPLTEQSFAEGLGWQPVDADAGAYLMTVISDRILVGIDDESVRPGIQRPVLPLATAATEAVGFPTASVLSDLFGPVPVGGTR